MLVRGGTLSEPTVVCNVHHKARTRFDGFANKVAEDGVVADVRRPVVRSIDRRFFSGDKVAFAEINVVEDREYIVEWNAFAKGDKVLFDVAFREVPIARSEEERGVVNFKTARVVDVRRDAQVIESSRENACFFCIRHLVQLLENERLPADMANTSPAGRIRRSGRSSLKTAELWTSTMSRIMMVRSR